MKDRILAGYEPAAVLGFFEDICAIPHVSGDERAVADYIEAFARARGLFCYRDEVNNVFLRRPASAGHEDAPAVMLQGHTDMVGERDADSTHDFATDGLALRVLACDGADWIAATGTTLGGDDGVAVAMMLAVLDNPPEPHPAIECLFTVSEEVGLEGAWAFDPARAGATATTVINLDSEAEGVVTAGCAGGVRTDIRIPVTAEPACGVAVTVALEGFSGGHSGVEIHEGHANAIRLLARLLRAADGGKLCAVSGGGKDNAIPRDARATLMLPADAVDAFRADVLAEADRVRREPNTIAADKDFSCTVTGGDAPAYMLSADSSRAVLAAIEFIPGGVLSMSAHVEGLVAYSRNLGILKTKFDGDGRPTSVTLSASTRSASASHIDDAQRELESLASVLGAVAGAPVTATHRARYPGWDYAPISPLRDRWMAASEALFAVKPHIEVIHAGLECGSLSDKLTAALGIAPDIISVGPDMRDIHTPREMLSIPSVERTYRLLCHVLSELA